MFRRLLLLVLTLCLAAPAVAMPLAPVAGHDLAMADCHGQAPDTKEQSREAADHGCIGCVAPFKIAFASGESALPIAPPVLPSLSAQRTDLISAPEPPPPRA